MTHRVSLLRKDGKAEVTEISGYGAEGLADKLLAEAIQARHDRYTFGVIAVLDSEGDFSYRRGAFYRDEEGLTRRLAEGKAHD